MSNEEQKTEKEMTFSVAVYACETAPIVYVGELSDETDVIQDDRIIFRKLMIQIHRVSKPDVGGQPKSTLAWGPAIASGRDSIVIIDRKAQPGTLVLSPDQAMVDEYRREIAKHFSGIHLL